MSSHEDPSSCITYSQLFTMIAPIVIALHERNLLDIAEIPSFYEDALMRRKFNLNASDAELEFLRQAIAGFQRLALAIKPPAA